MAATRDLSNKRVKFGMGAANAVATVLQPTLAELAAMLDVTAATRWDGFDFGMQESDQEDDRSLADEAAAVIRSFASHGGSVPFFAPRATDTSSILRLVFNLVKGRNTELVNYERVGWKDASAALAAGDVVNVYRTMTDGWTWDTEGTGGYAYILSLLARGDSNPWYIIPAASPAPVTVTGGATGTLTVAGGSVLLREAFYQGHNITGQAIWTSSNPAVATVEDGIIVPVSAGTANIVASYPGGTAATAIAVTVS